MEKMNGYSLDIVKENISKIKEIFPEVFCEDKVDFERLQEVLGEYVEDKEERYRFEWHGKSKAIRMAQTPSRGTLRPCKEESKNWDTTENLYIEGDNLEVLKLLQKSYQNKIKMIYIDPPYNTGNDFVYKDDYKDNLSSYLAITGQVDDEGNRTSTNSETSGRYHTNWLNMMYPRLRLAKNLLKKDGVIFISIDDIEIVNLKKVCDEIFGEENFESIISWRRRHNQPNDKSKMIAKVSEYMLVYAKNSEYLREKKTYYGLPLTENRISDYKNPDNDFNGPWSTNPWKAATGRGGSSYKIMTPTGIEFDETWYGNEETFKQLRKNGRVHWTDNGNGFPRIKIYLKDAMKEGQAGINFFTHERFGSNQEGSMELERLFEKKGIFDNPKPTKLLKSLLKLSTKGDDIIMDFFSGTSGLANSVIELNNEDKCNRKFIMVQLPELIDEKSDTYKAGYKNICEIGKERIRRAGDIIVEENKEGIDDLDIGFKVFKLDTSNIKPWNPKYDNVEMSLEDVIDNFLPGRTEEDVVYEIMLKYGIDLTYPIEVREVSGKKVFSIGFGALIICLDDEITLEVVNGIVDLKNELNPETTRVVFKDNGFKTDSVKTNTIEILKRNNINEVMSI
ncbi:site-specific DNA-methyltransferase [Clostridium sp.]|uniref:site-specific DNA-methyltransferase n=1 Tax=Clostridium sp. TaxID=1506 RepID=UPI003464A523